MRNRTAIPLLIVLLLATAAVGEASALDLFKHGWSGVKGSRDLETRAFDLDDFDSVQLDGAFDVSITVGEDQSVKVTLDDNLFEELDLRVDGRTLVLDFERNCRPSEAEVVITVRQLEEVEVNGAGDIDIRGFDGGDFAYSLRGAGNLEAEGRLDVFDVRLTGVGDIKARDLVARDVEVKISGVGKARVHATDSFSGSIPGMGDIDCYGDPEQRRARVSGLGDIDFK